MRDQDINRTIAEGLEHHGLGELAYDSAQVACSHGHAFVSDVPFAPRVGARCPYDRICDGTITPVPHDFTRAEYLYPALEAWCAEYQMLFRCAPSDGGVVWFARVHHAQRMGEIFDGDGPTLSVALRNAFAKALEREKGAKP